MRENGQKPEANHLAQAGEYRAVDFLQLYNNNTLS